MRKITPVLDGSQIPGAADMTLRQLCEMHLGPLEERLRARLRLWALRYRKAQLEERIAYLSEQISYRRAVLEHAQRKYYRVQGKLWCAEPASNLFDTRRSTT